LLAVGTRNDNGQEVRRPRRILADKGYDITFREVPHGHDWSNWGLLLDDVRGSRYGPEGAARPSAPWTGKARQPFPWHRPGASLERPSA